MATKENSVDMAGLEVNVGQLNLGRKGAVKTATATAGAATLNAASGKVTSEALTTAAAATYTLTITSSEVAAADQVYVQVDFGTNTAGLPVVTKVTPAAGSVVILVTNLHSANAFNGTLVVSYMVVKV